jgi:hypothetical protein
MRYLTCSSNATKRERHGNARRKAREGWDAMNRNFWYCNVCNAQNHVEDGECQYCECGGLECKRDNCSAPEHFHAEHDGTFECVPPCPLCAQVSK